MLGFEKKKAQTKKYDKVQPNQSSKPVVNQKDNSDEGLSPIEAFRKKLHEKQQRARNAQPKSLFQ